MHRQRDFLCPYNNARRKTGKLVDGCHRVSRWLPQAAIPRVDLYGKVQHRRQGEGR